MLQVFLALAVLSCATSFGLAVTDEPLRRAWYACPAAFGAAATLLVAAGAVR